MTHEIYTLVSAVIFCMLGAVWNRTNALNVAIKCALFGLTIWGVLLSR